MPIPHRDTPIFEFDGFRLEPGERRFLRGDEPITLKPKAFDLLVLLVANAGKLMTKEDLLSTLWPDSVVEESNLTHYVATLRKALGNAPTGKSYITTLSRFGYRFDGIVTEIPLSLVTVERHSVTRIVTEEIEISDPPGVHTFPVPAGERLLSGQRRTWPRPGLVAVGCLIGTLGLLGGWWMRTPNPTVPATPHIIPFTTFQGRETRPAFSPDGRRLAFVWEGESHDNEDIYIKDRNGTNLRRLTTNPAKDNAPVWSPDGKSVAFHRLPSGEVIIVPADGGNERTIGTAWDLLDWSPDGRNLLIADSVGTVQRLFLLEVGSGTKRQLTTDDNPEESDARAAFSPDGKSVAVVRYRHNNSDIHLIPVTGGTPVRLTFDNRLVDSLDWTEDGTEIVFSSNRSGSFLPWRIPRDGGQPIPIASVKGSCRDMTVVGTTLAYQLWNEDRNIFRLDLTAAEKPPVRIVASTERDDAAIISNDGKSLIFNSFRSGATEIWTCGPNGENQQPLTSFGGPMVGSARLSPDGDRIVFDRIDNNRPAVYVTSIRGGTPQRLTEGIHRDVLPSWSRDGKWIYFCSDRSGRREVWKMPVAGGDPVQLTRNGGWEAFESADGRRVFFTQSPQVSPVILTVENGREESFQVFQSVGRHRYWWPARTGLYSLELSRESGWMVVRYDFATHKSVPVAKLSLDWSGPRPGGLCVSADETFCVFDIDDHPGSDIVVVENWR